MWNLKECATTCSMSPRHGGLVSCLAAHADGALVMSGSEDSTARLVSTSAGKVCDNIETSETPQGSHLQRNNMSCFRLSEFDVT